MKILTHWKSIFILAGILLAGIALSCTRNLAVPVNPAMAGTATQIAGNATSTSTPTSTPIGGIPTNTFTPTPIPGAPTNTFTPTPLPPTATYTPTVPAPTPTVVYANGTWATLGGPGACYLCPWEGGGDGGGTSNSADTTAASPYPNGDTQAFSVTYPSLTAGGWTGLSAQAQYTVNGAVTTFSNFEGYTTCSFYACANETGQGGFEAMVPQATSSTPATLVTENLTTSWQKFTLNISDGHRTDSYANNAPPGTTIAQVASYFIESVPSVVGTPFIIYIDDLQCQ